MSKHYGYGQGSRRKIIKKWEENNIFDEDGVDMLGVLMDEENVQSVHHIFDRYGNCVGVSCLSRYIHDYLDFYLRDYDKEEYHKWNEYLKDVYEYITNNVRMISLYELKTLRNELLIALKTNQDYKLDRKTKKKYYKIKYRVKPYISNDISDIESLYRTMPNVYKFIHNNELPVDASLALKKLYERIEDYEPTLDYVSSLHSIVDRKKSIGKVHLHKNKELSKIISENCNTDAFGLNLGYMTDRDINVEELFGKDVFLYDRSIDILNFVKKHAPVLYNEWISLFSTYPNRNDNYQENAYFLRMRTYMLLRKKCKSSDKKNTNNMLRLRKSLIRNESISKQA